MLNGTKFVGFAKAVSTALSNRQFKVTGWDNYKGKKVERTTIYFGKTHQRGVHAEHELHGRGDGDG